MTTSANDSTAMQIIMNSQYAEFPETLLTLELCRATARADGRKIGESLRACAKVKARQAKNRNLFNTLTEMSRSQFPEVQMIRIRGCVERMEKALGREMRELDITAEDVIEFSEEAA
ncbi:DUF7740 domain-containing protein [Leclercia adecarboxylata]|uniref:DUF7740 domain-containing protein n=1 Tax=Leclercia adecarboxylata TaxID=83655 RepID=UPI00202699C9|nr:hypothetical protein [Leclercia adecarboxylata]URM24023.1 hypothetical protein JJN11_05720 [Leclercia adecarboxylata]